MGTPVLDHRLVDSTARRRRSWLVPITAAAAVATLAVGTAWWTTGGGPVDGGRDAGATATPEVAQRVLLDAPGWTVEHAGADDGVGYAKGDLELEVTEYPASTYDVYVRDRRHLADPPAAGEPVEVLGLGGQMWAYSPDDHTTIRQVQDGSWLEVRASGMDEAAYLALLDRLRLVDEATFEARMPEEFVRDGERDAALEEITRGIVDAAGTLVPAGSGVTVTSDELDPYVLGAEVAGQVACAWLTSYVESRAAGDRDGMREAARVLETSRDWPVLREIDVEGDYPEVVWGYADEVVAGEVPEGYVEGLGCRR